MINEAEKLYTLLPALYRIRDAEQGGPLKAFISVLAEQVALLREDMDQHYDNQFIETCAEWVAPYIGDLIGYRTIHGVNVATASRRAEVANTIAYRRRKGTASVLEQLARDVTGWNARVVEFFQLLGTTQYMNHLRLNKPATPDLRHWEPLERHQTAFDTLAHNVEVRRISTQKGRYNIPNVGLFLWRLDAYRLRRSPAFRVDARRFLFSPLGNNTQLVTRPETEEKITHLASPMNVPEDISRRVLHENLSAYYGQDLSFWLEVAGFDTTPANIQICNLSDDGGGWAHMPSDKIAVDPVLGRIAFPADQAADVDIRVTFHSAFSKAMGGGEYERRKGFSIGGTPDQTLSQGDQLQPALDVVVNGGLVEISDSGRYVETPLLNSNAGANIELRAANEHRPALVLGGDMEINIGAGSELVLNGLLISGGTLRVLAGAEAGPRILRLRHCTLVPGLRLTPESFPVSPGVPGIVIEQADLTLKIDHCILGGIRALRGTQVAVENSIIDANSQTNIAFSSPDDVSAGGVLSILNSTVIGKVHSERFDLVSNTIFDAGLSAADIWTAPIRSAQKQQGCVRFSYLPEEAIVPRPYRCQPDLAITEAIKKAEFSQPGLSDAQKEAIAIGVRRGLQPSFRAQYGRADYGQLNACPEEIRVGAEDESEMGAFHDLFAPQREANLRIRLDEYLRFGLEAGILFAS